MTPGDGQKLYFKEEAKINEMAIGQNLFPITLDLKNTPESHLNKEEAHETSLDTSTYASLGVLHPHITHRGWETM